MAEKSEKPADSTEKVGYTHAAEGAAAAPGSADASPMMPGSADASPPADGTRWGPYIAEGSRPGTAVPAAKAIPQTTKQASLKFSIQDQKDEVFCVKFSPDDSLIAMAFGNGACGINNTVTGRHSFMLGGKKGNELVMPMTQLRWRPVPTRSKADLMVSVSSDGCVSLWHVSARKRLFEVEEKDNQLFCVDYAADASTLATSGKEPCIRIYDEATMKVIQTLSGGDITHGTGHSNRIFALKYHPVHPNMIVTGSWDKKVQYWDTRVGYAVKALYGPLISGDAVDISSDGSTILTGSCRRDTQLQLWDYGTGKLISTKPWLAADGKDSPCKLYCAQFSKNKTADFKTGSLMIAAGGSKPDVVKLFDMSTDQVFHEIPDVNGGCYSLDFSSDSDMLAVAAGDGKVQVLLLDQNKHKGA